MIYLIENFIAAIHYVDQMGLCRFQFLIQLSKLSLQPKIKEITPLFGKLPDSITVVRQTLTLFVLVRIQVRQHRPRNKQRGLYLFKSGCWLHTPPYLNRLDPAEQWNVAGLLYIE